MKEAFIIAICSFTFFISCKNKEHKTTAHMSISLCNDDCGKPLVCKLTSPELQQRKATVIDRLQKNLLEKRELQNGYAFRFSSTDEMIDTLTSFIKTERQCCDFFTFTLILKTDSCVWLELAGPEGTKEFIKNEMQL